MERLGRMYLNCIGRARLEQTNPPGKSFSNTKWGPAYGERLTAHMHTTASSPSVRCLDIAVIILSSQMLQPCKENKNNGVLGGRRCCELRFQQDGYLMARASSYRLCRLPPCGYSFISIQDGNATRSEGGPARSACARDHAFTEIRFSGLCSRLVSCRTPTKFFYRHRIGK